MRRVPLLVVPLLVALVGSIAAAAPQQPDARATALIARIVQPGLPDQIGLVGRRRRPRRSRCCPGTPIRRTARSSRSGRPMRRSSPRPARPRAPRRTPARSRCRCSPARSRSTPSTCGRASPRGPSSASGNVAASSLTGLTVLGQLITPAPDLVVPLADWGTLEVLGSSVDTVAEAAAVVDRGRDGHPRQADRRSRWARVGQRDRGRVRHGRRGRRPGRRHPRAKADGDAAHDASRVRPVIPPDAPREPGTSIPGAPPALVRPAPAVTAQLTSGRLRLSGLRPRVVRRHVRGTPRRRQGRLASR